MKNSFEKPENNLSREKIALLAFFFPPDESIGAVRPKNWANELAITYDLSVISGPYNELQNRTPSQFNVFYTKSLSLKIIKYLNQIRVNSRIKKATLEESKNSANRSRGIFTYRLPCLYDIWAFSIFWSLKKIKPKIIIATHGPYISLVVAAIWKKLNPEVIFIADFRDLWVGNPHFLGAGIFRSIEKILEKFVLENADLITTVSNGLASYFHNLGFEEKTKVILNDIDHQSYSTLPRKRFFPNDHKFRIAYTGSIYPEFQDPTPLFKEMHALKLSGEISSTSFQLVFASKSPGDLMARARMHNIDEYVNFVGHISRSDCMRIQRDAEVLLLMESETEERKGVLTGKVFEYLATGKKILSIGIQKDSELGLLLSRYNAYLTLEEFIEDIKTKSLNKYKENISAIPMDDTTCISEEIITLMKQKNGNTL
ncbi:glycosyltransferase [Leeia oryzae]|uniref:glycosyltransferase n=1 Tax=Leeia oryzae TaxID=356662 RepID=UPI00037F522E|nr:glycosyltransferase [Leeia oryzae]